jgi:hypothetical protein
MCIKDYETEIGRPRPDKSCRATGEKSLCYICLCGLFELETLMSVEIIERGLLLNDRDV